MILFFIGKKLIIIGWIVIMLLFGSMSFLVGKSCSIDDMMNPMVNTGDLQFPDLGVVDIWIEPTNFHPKDKVK